MTEAENSSKFPSGRSIALRRPGRAVAISMTPQLAGRRVRHSGKRRFPAIFLRPLPGSAAAPPAPLAPHPGLRLGDCGLPKVTPPGPAGPGPILPAPPRLALPSSRAPREPLPQHGGAGPGDPSKGARPSRHCRVPLPRRLRSPPAQSRPGRALTAAGTRCLRPPARGRPMSERGCRGNATRPWLLGRNSAASLLPCFPPSCRASAPRGGGDWHGPIRAAGPARAAGRGRPWLGSCAAGPLRRAGDADPQPLGAASERGWLWGGVRGGRRG